jgi:hypothetical protein
MWTIKILKRAGVYDVANVDAEMARLIENAEERGSEDGTHDLPAENSIKNLDAQLRVIAEKRFGLARVPDKTLAGQEARWQKELEETESDREAHRAKMLARTPPKEVSIIPAKIRWLPAIANVLILAAFIALVLNGAGIGNGWRGFTALALGAALLLINLPVLPELARGGLAWVGYGLITFGDRFGRHLFNARVKRLNRQISQLRDRQEDEAARRRLAEVWFAQQRELILSHYFLFRARAEKAARLADRKDQNIAASLKPDLAAIESNGNPPRATHIAKRKDYAVAEVGPYP